MYNVHRFKVSRCFVQSQSFDVPKTVTALYSFRNIRFVQKIISQLVGILADEVSLKWFCQRWCDFKLCSKFVCQLNTYTKFEILSLPQTDMEKLRTPNKITKFVYSDTQNAIILVVSIVVFVYFSIIIGIYSDHFHQLLNSFSFCKLSSINLGRNAHLMTL